MFNVDQKPHELTFARCLPQVAQFKSTVLLMPNGSDRITSSGTAQKLESEKKVFLPPSPAFQSANVICGYFGQLLPAINLYPCPALMTP